MLISGNKSRKKELKCLLFDLKCNNNASVLAFTDRDFVRAEKYKTEAEKFGWSFVFQDFVSEELKSKVTQRIEV